MYNIAVTNRFRLLSGRLCILHLLSSTGRHNYDHGDTCRNGDRYLGGDHPVVRGVHELGQHEQTQVVERRHVTELVLSVHTGVLFSQIFLICGVLHPII